jgi:2-polyprenyl-3-methyl-5-hydroxy-6-metoxy-1,4-benzoquinol methylase
MNMTTEQFLSRLLEDRVQGYHFNYMGKRYALPYQTIIVNGEQISGLRETTKRFELFKKIFEENNVEYKSYLDVACNFSYFLNRFSDHFEKTTGVEYDYYYIELVKELYPNLNVIHNDVNITRLSKLFTEKFEVITALSMIEYINDKKAFVEDLYDLSEKIVIVEGHTMDSNNGNDKIYDSILRTMPWNVVRLPPCTDNGINAPPEALGRPLWICKK